MLLRTHISDCELTSAPLNTNPSEENKEKQSCSELRREARLVRRVYPYYLNYLYQSDDSNDVTLVSQTSVDRLHMLEALCKHWKGPLSIALYATDADMKEVMAHISSSSVLKNTKKLALHMVSKSGTYYPINQLRNIALNYAKTP